MFAVSEAPDPRLFLLFPRQALCQLVSRVSVKRPLSSADLEKVLPGLCLSRSWQWQVVRDKATKNLVKFLRYWLTKIRLVTSYHNSCLFPDLGHESYFFIRKLVYFQIWNNTVYAAAGQLAQWKKAYDYQFKIVLGNILGAIGVLSFLGLILLRRFQF